MIWVILLGIGILLMFSAGVIGAAEMDKKRRLKIKYGADSASPESRLLYCEYYLPSDKEQLQKIVSCICGDEEAQRMVSAVAEPRELVERLLTEGYLLRLEEGFSTERLAEGINKLLQKDIYAAKLRSISKEEIIAIENEFSAGRRADGMSTARSDLNMAAYILRCAGLEPAIIKCRKTGILSQTEASASEPKKPSFFGDIVIIPIERMYEFCGLFRSI